MPLRKLFGSPEQSFGVSLCDDSGNYISALLLTDFETEVELGNVPGHVIDTKFGRVTGIDAADGAVDVWAFADDTASPRRDQKVFPTTADTIYLASTSTSDTAVDVTTSYINASGLLASRTDTLTGQTAVNTGVTALDVNRIFVSGSTAAVGTIYCAIGDPTFTAGVPSDTSKIVAVSPAGYQQSQLSQFTVPLQKTLIMKNVIAPVSRASGAAGSADVQLLIQEPGGVFRVRREFFPTTAVPVDSGVDGTVVPGGSHIVWRVTDVSDADTNVSVAWKYEMIDD